MSPSDATAVTASVAPLSEPGAPAAAPSEDRPLPLEALERALAPVRRVTRWASSDPAQRVPAVRYLETNVQRWLHEALALDLPHAVRDQLATLAGQLSGFDAAGPEARQQRLVVMDQVIRRLDAQLGLPAPVPLRASPSRTRSARAERPAEAAPPKKRKARRREPAQSPPPAPPVREPEPAPPDFWSGNLDEGLADLDLPEPLLDHLVEAGLETVRDVLARPPVRVDVIRPVQGAGREVGEGQVAVGGRVGARFTRLRPDGQRTSGITLRGAGVLEARYSQPPSWERGTDRWLEELTPDRRIVVVARHEGGVLLDPEPSADDGAHAVRQPLYGVPGVDDRAIRALIRRLLQGGRVQDPLPAEVRSRVGVLPLGEALAEVHLGGPRRHAGRARLAFDELLAAQVALSAPRFQSTRERGFPMTIQHTLASRLGGGEALILDDAQQLALEDIKRDLRRPAPMLRALLGEVGTGKGTVALAAAVMVAETKSQVLYVTPDRTTAEQRFTFAEPLLREAGLVARLVEEAPSRAMRDAVGRGEVHVVFGSLDLLVRGLDFRRLGLVVAEERERWGRASASIRKLRAPRPHALVVPRTPLGAAVALTAYSDHDLTVLGRVTPAEGARPVAVEVVQAARRAEAYARAAAAIDEGRQVLVVFPMVQGADALTPREAMRVVRALEEDALQGARVRLYHGGSPREERQRIFDDFRHRRFDALVATTLVEDGPAVPDASFVVVEQADRVEPTRLQRILGYVSHARHDAVAVLVMGDLSDEEALGRVHALVGPDGFAQHDAFVAEQGLEGMVVEGSPPLPRFAWATLSREEPPRRKGEIPSDRELLWRAREVVHEVMGAEPTLRRGLAAELAQEARARFAELWPEQVEDQGWRCNIPESAPPERRRRRRRRRKR